MNCAEVFPEHFPEGEFHEQAGDEGCNEDSGAGGGEPIECEDCCFGGFLRRDGRDALHDLMQSGDLGFEDREAIEECFDVWEAPDENEGAQQEPGDPGCEYLLAREDFYLWFRRVFLEFPDALWFPEAE